MEIDIKNLPNSPELLQKIIDDLQKELISYKEKYARVLEEIRLSKYHRFSSSSEKNPLQSDLFDEAGVDLTPDLKEQIEDVIAVKDHIRQKHPVRKELPSDFPREKIIHDIPESEKICECGSHLVKIGEEISEQLKYIPAQLSVTQHIRPKYACKPCQGTLKIAPMPILLLPKSIASPELVAHTIISKYADHTPLYRQEAIWRRLEIDLPRSSLCAWILKTAEICVPLVRLLQKNIVNGNYTQADETTVQVLEEVGRSNQTKSFMWVYKGGDRSRPSLVFEYQETRGGYHAQEFLKGFKGYLQTDAFSGYHFVDKEKEIIGVGCMAHARRRFVECAKLSKKQGLATEALKFFLKLYMIEKEAREKILYEGKINTSS
jgi:transposase